MKSTQHSNGIWGFTYVRKPTSKRAVNLLRNLCNDIVLFHSVKKKKRWEIYFNSYLTWEYSTYMNI